MIKAEVEKQEKLKDRMYKLGYFEEFLMMREADKRGILYQRNEKKYVTFQKDGRKLLFRKGWSNLNSKMTSRIATQKEVLNRIMLHNGIKASEGTVFYSKDVERAWSYSEKMLPVVVKPNASIKGKNVHVEIYDKSAFIEAFKDVCDIHGNALIEKYYPGESLRITSIGGKVVAAYFRSPASIVGDGVSSVNKLIEEENAIRKSLPRNALLDLTSSDILNNLSGVNLSLNSIPAKGQVVVLSKVMNRNRGAVLNDCTRELDLQLVKVIESACLLLPGFSHGGWDVILSDDGPVILELNADSGFASHYFVRHGEKHDVAPRILDLKFEK